MHEELLDLLLALDGVEQSPRYHPEGDALFHSLQVFQLARAESDDRELWAAALFHDVGKSIPGPGHDEVGAELLEGLVSDRVLFLVRHHLDLLRDPRRTERRYRGTDHPGGQLRDLRLLRRWDLLGRSPHTEVPTPRAAMRLLLDHERNDGLHL